MPLSLADVGADNTIRKIGGSPEIKQHLQDLGFVIGENICVISTLGGNVIVKIKDSRVAINDELARKIMIG